jgi:uncharacterized membrane protein SpoIIM required for sporulation
MSAVIMANNIRVAMLALAFGVIGGVGTAWVLFYNGIILGALAAYVTSIGGASNALIFWSLILPHGVPELYAIFLAGACGLLIGKGMLIPGSYTRRDALIKNAREAVVLVPMVVILLVVAGLIEGFFTPLGVSPYFKLGFAGLAFMALALYAAKR